MKKFLVGVIALLALSAPALAQFSVGTRLEANYSTTLAPNLTAGVLGRLEVPITPTFGVGVLVRPFIQYGADLVNEGPLSVSAYARVRLPISLDIAPTSGFSFSISPQAGVDLAYDLGSGASLSSGLRLVTTLPIAPSGGSFSWLIDGYVEFGYALDMLSLYAGISLDQIVPSPFAQTIYLGASYDVLSNLTFNPEFGFSNFDFNTAYLTLRFALKL
ncbi:hypothetical protein [Meiothermus sp.]|jgi:hypothetical protein|uniref:hypothetical protein n=1 Tax=Meiothermus sp. TaxID=1955249 RepID=UPI0021DE5706|nr:hypothetical protein [Meiothermus sp.]GIW23882.1 MAG: hypothetical protein KatS3mg069_0149 [Meiothermus sp.]